MAKNILVTGCAGFIGSNFIKQFRKQSPKTEIIGIDDLSSGDIKSIDRTDKKITFYKGSILDKKIVRKIFHKHKPDFVFHFAAIPEVSYSTKHPAHTSDVNISGTAILLEASRDFGVKRFIFSSSAAVYGNTKELPTSEKSLPDPKSFYAGQKCAGEILCKISSDLFQLDTVCLRYFNVFGPGQRANSAYAALIPSWLDAVNNPSKRAFIEGDGKQTRDFCFIENVVSANMLAMKSTNRLNGQIFNIANGKQTSINKVRMIIEKQTNKKLNLEKRPGRIGDIKHSYANIYKAKKILGYVPKIDFEEGLKRTIKELCG